MDKIIYNFKMFLYVDDTDEGTLKKRKSLPSKELLQKIFEYNLTTLIVSDDFNIDQLIAHPCIFDFYY